MPDDLGHLRRVLCGQLATVGAVENHDCAGLELRGELVFLDLGCLDRLVVLREELRLVLRRGESGRERHDEHENKTNENLDGDRISESLVEPVKQHGHDRNVQKVDCGHLYESYAEQFYHAVLSGPKALKI